MDIIRLDPFQGVAANGRATLVTDQLDGMSVHGIMLQRGNGGGAGFTATHMTNIVMRAMQKDLLNTITGPQLQDINDYDGLPSVTDFIAHFFGDPLARTVRGQHMGDLDFSVHKGKFEMRVDIAAAAVAPTLSALAIVGPPKKSMGIGLTDAEALMVRALIFSQVNEGAAVNRKAEQIGLGSGAGARIRKLCLFHTNLTRVEYKKQGIVKHEDLTDAENDAYQQQFGRVPQAGLYVVDRIVDGNQGEADDTLRPDGQPWNLQVLMTTSAADTISNFADVHTMPQLL